MREDRPRNKDFGQPSNFSKESIYEGMVIHDGNHCRQIAGCKVCTPQHIVNELEEKRKLWFKEQHKGRNERARERQKKQVKAKATNITPLDEELQKQRKLERKRRQESEWNPLEDFEE